MPSTRKIVVAAQVSADTILTGANLNGLANASLFLGSAYDNTQGASGDGYRYAQVEGLFDLVGTVAIYTTFVLWFVPASDGTNYADGSSSVTPARPPDVAFVLRGVTGAHSQRVVGLGKGSDQRVELPPGLWKPLIRNSSGSALVASATSSVKIRRWTDQGVSS